MCITACATQREQKWRTSQRETLLSFRLSLTLVCSLLFPREGGYRESKEGQTCYKWCVLAQDLSETGDALCPSPVTSENLLGTTFASTAVFRPSSWCVACAVISASRDAWQTYIHLLKHHVIGSIEAVFWVMCPRFMPKCQPAHLSTWPWGRWPSVFSTVPWEHQQIWHHYIVLIKSLTSPH